MKADNLCAFGGVKGAEFVVRSKAMSLAKNFKLHPRVRESCYSGSGRKVIVLP